MRDQRIDNVEFARRLGPGVSAVSNLLDPEESNPSDLQSALEAVGKALVVSVEDAA